MKALLVRHAESTGQAPDAPLTAAGRTQAVSLATWLVRHPIDHIVSSPHLRARETIAPFATATSIDVHVDARLVERRLASGLLEVVAEWRDAVRRSFDDPDHRLPGGESGREAARRGREAIDAVLGHHRLPCLVTHGQLLSLVLHSIDPAFGFEAWSRLQNPDVFAIEQTTDGQLTFARWTPARSLV